MDARPSWYTEIIPLMNPVALEHTRTAIKLADDLETFVDRYPDPELRRETGHIISRLRKIAAISE